LVVTALLTMPTRSRADFIVNLNAITNGTVPPSGSAPWLTADFHTVSTGDVILTMSNVTTGGDSLDYWLFNTVAGLNPASLGIAHLSGDTALSVTQSADVLAGTSPAAHAGLFDIMFQFKNTGNPSGRFISGESSVYEIKGTGITAESFQAVSLQDRFGDSGYTSAAHLMSIPTAGGTASTDIAGLSLPEPNFQVATPVPSSLILCLSGFAAPAMVAGIRRVRSRLSRLAG
jgi:hypothetical protein